MGLNLQRQQILATTSFCLALQLNTEKGKVVAYVTSFRSVRGTFEECRYILDLFHNLRVRVEARDVYTSQFHLRELEERLKWRGHVIIPQVFIGGQHVGVRTSVYHVKCSIYILTKCLCFCLLFKGRRELEELNETGELRKILEDYPVNHPLLK